ncbi:MAG: hypothetical protein KDC34_16760 [Saprospiraceae bacterium]|nr:hypothetical protein [Saprospiraceae bacterium]
MGVRWVIVVFFVIGCSTLHAQIGLKYSPELSENLITGPLASSSFVSEPVLSFGQDIQTTLPATAPQAFFCRLEWQLEKSIQVPVKFRLGDVQYVDQLEGKRRTY